jgi:hypothetical protein
LRIATRKERANLRAQRESRRRDAAVEPGNAQAGEQPNPPADGAGSS